jgi:hypothetical protein
MMNADAQLLAKRMALLSERAYCAEWMDGLEVALWRIANAGGGEYGQTTVSCAEATELLRLAGVAKGWIATDDEGEERLVSLEEWVSLYADSLRLQAPPDAEEA